jgi:hypothetical protein
MTSTRSHYDRWNAFNTGYQFQFFSQFARVIRWNWSLPPDFNYLTIIIPGYEDCVLDYLEALRGTWQKSSQITPNTSGFHWGDWNRTPSQLMLETQQAMPQGTRYTLTSSTTQLDPIWMTTRLTELFYKDSGISGVDDTWITLIAFAHSLDGLALRAPFESTFGKVGNWSANLTVSYSPCYHLPARASLPWYR